MLDIQFIYLRRIFKEFLLFQWNKTLMKQAVSYLKDLISYL